MGSKLCETFNYDSLDWLDTVRRNGTLTLDANYDLSGNLTSRSDVGTYTYHATRKHAVITAGSSTYAYDANGNVITRNGATLGWASYDLPTSLASGGNTASFAYTPDRARWRQIAVTAGVTETTIYVAGILEKVTKPSVTLWKHYVASPTGMGAVYVRRSDGTSDTYYLTTDQLGGTDRILKAATGTVQVAESFDAFGKRRGSDWQGGPSAADLTAIGNSTPDGFTGHEMLDGVGLIHMNGRVYDPTVGRFLSVDPIVRDTAASQSWNGYGYVEGRMLSATDPSGFLPIWLKFLIKPEDCAGAVVCVDGKRGQPGVRSVEGPTSIDRALRELEPRRDGISSENAPGGGGEAPQQEQDQLKDRLCSIPAISYGLQIQFYLGSGGLGWQASFGASFTTHGQFLFQAQGGGMFGLHAGAAVSLSPQVGAIGVDPQRGWSDQSVVVAQVIAVEGPLGAGYALQAGGGNGQVGVAHGRVRLGPSLSAGALVSASGGRQDGKQYASAGNVRPWQCG